MLIYVFSHFYQPNIQITSVIWRITIISPFRDTEILILSVKISYKFTKHKSSITYLILRFSLTVKVRRDSSAIAKSIRVLLWNFLKPSKAFKWIEDDKQLDVVIRVSGAFGCCSFVAFVCIVYNFVVLLLHYFDMCVPFSAN